MSNLFTCHDPARGQFGPCSYCGFAIPRSHRQKCPCRAVNYCNRLCQRRDWSTHKNVCSYDGWESAIRRALKLVPKTLEDYIFNVFLVGREVYKTSSTEAQETADATFRLSRLQTDVCHTDTAAASLILKGVWKVSGLKTRLNIESDSV